MFIYLMRRVVYIVPILLSVAVICFLLVHVAPGDPLMAILPPDAPRELALQVRAAYGFDQPLPVQFWKWLMHVMRGDMGASIATARPVAGEVWQALKNTTLLSCTAVLIGFITGTVFGLLSGYYRDSLLDRILTSITVAGVSLPHYWLAMVMVIVFAIWLRWLPALGAGPNGASSWEWDWLHMRHLVLPALSMSVVPMSIIARTLRAIISDLKSQDFVEALHAKGLTGGRIFYHVVKNAAPTAVSVMGLQLGYLLGGSILIETVFSWPGTGFLLNSAIFQRDIPLLQGTVLVLASIFVVLNLAVDLLQAWIDPRIQRN